MGGQLVSSRLGELELTIERGMKSFVAVGNALLEIREARLYKERGFARFEDYCQQHWGMSRPQAYRMIDSAKVVEAVSPMGDIAPANERQARELAPLLDDPGTLEAVWAKVVSSGSPVTAKAIKAAVAAAKAPPTPEPDPAPEPAPTTQTIPAAGNLPAVEVAALTREEQAEAREMFSALEALAKRYKKVGWTYLIRLPEEEQQHWESLINQLALRVRFA